MSAVEVRYFFHRVKFEVFYGQLPPCICCYCYMLSGVFLILRLKALICLLGIFQFFFPLSIRLLQFQMLHTTIKKRCMQSIQKNDLHVSRVYEKLA
jgi:hypothetical protein